MNQNKIIGLLLITAAVTGYTAFSVFHKNSAVLGSAKGEAPTFYSASSTAFTLTTASQRLLGTSTPTRRLAATIQPINCTQNVFMRAGSDVVATANTGLVAFASSTFSFEEYPGIPVVQGAVQGITAVGTCTVLVTEWRSQY